VIFGAQDGLFGRFAPLVRWLPFLPLAGAMARFQPVYVGDVAAAVLKILADEQLGTGAQFDLGGPEIWTLRQIVDYTARMTGHLCPVVPLGKGFSRLQAEVCEHLPGKPFSRDNWRSLTCDSIVPARNGLDTLGIAPTPIARIMPALLEKTPAARRA
jgi:NADH dehydrogenase